MCLDLLEVTGYGLLPCTGTSALDTEVWVLRIHVIHTLWQIKFIV